MTNVIVTRNKVIQVDTVTNVRPPNVVVTKKRDIHLTSGAPASLVDATAGVVLSNPTMSTRLDRLRDVDASNEVEGATLVYDARTGKYVVSYLDLRYTTGTFSAGTF